MKIGFDITPLRDGNKIRGVGSYANLLLEELKKSNNLEIKEFYDDKSLSEVDLVHHPFFDLFKPTLVIQKKFPTVVTIHDVIPLVFPEHYPPGIKGKFNLLHQRIALRSVKAVITDSYASKKDINKYLNIPENKIYPILLAPSDHFKRIKDEKELTRIRNKFSLPEDFALYVGNINWNKNLINLAQSCVETNTHLVMVGKSFKTVDINHRELLSFKVFMENYSGNPLIQIIDEFVETDELVGFYSLAMFTLFPSFYEGFGFPILESQACGTPVITSDLSSMKEISGDSAFLVNPASVESIKEAILKIREDANLRKTLIDRGYSNVKKYSWEKAAQETVNVYEKVINRK